MAYRHNAVRGGGVGATRSRGAYQTRGMARGDNGRHQQPAAASITTAAPWRVIIPSRQRVACVPPGGVSGSGRQHIWRGAGRAMDNLPHNAAHQHPRSRRFRAARRADAAYAGATAARCRICFLAPLRCACCLMAQAWPLQRTPRRLRGVVVRWFLSLSPCATGCTHTICLANKTLRAVRVVRFGFCLPQRLVCLSTRRLYIRIVSGSIVTVVFADSRRTVVLLSFLVVFTIRVLRFVSLRWLTTRCGSADHAPYIVTRLRDIRSVPHAVRTVSGSRSDA